MFLYKPSLLQNVVHVLLWIAAFSMLHGNLKLKAEDPVKQERDVVSSTKPPAVKLFAPDSIVELVTLGKTSFRHEGTITAIRQIPHSSWIATGARDDTARVWDAKTGKEIYRLPHKDSVWSIASEHDGKHLLTAGGKGNIFRWDLATGKKTKTYKSEEKIFRMAIFPDQKKLLAVGGVGLVSVWEIASGKKIKHYFPLKPSKTDLYGCDVAPDGKSFAICGVNGIARIQSTEDYSVLHTLKHPSNDIFTIVFSPDGKKIGTCSSDGMVRMFASDSAKLIWEKDFGSVKVLHFSDDGKKLSISKVGSGAIIVNPKDGEIVSEFEARGSEFWPVRFGVPTAKNDGASTLLVGAKTDLFCWDTATGEQQFTDANGFTRIQGFGMSADSQRLIIGDRRGALYSWNARTQKIDIVKDVETDFRGGFPMSADGRLIAVFQKPGSMKGDKGKDGTDKKSDLKKPDVEKVDGTVEAFEPNKIVIYNTHNLSVRNSFPFPNDNIVKMDFIAGNSLLLIRLRDSYEVWNIKTGKKHWSPVMGEEKASIIYSNPDSSNVVLRNYSDHNLHVVNALQRTEMRDLETSKPEEVEQCIVVDSQNVIIVSSERNKEGDRKWRITRWRGSQIYHKLTPEKVTAHISQLNSRLYKERAAATEQLIANGQSVYQYLEAAEDPTFDFTSRIKMIEREILRSNAPHIKCPKKISHVENIRVLAVHPDHRHMLIEYETESGDDEIRVVEIQEDGLELLDKKINFKSTPLNIKFNHDGASMIVNNRDGTTTLFSCAASK